jgi:hypothetical protein
MKLLLSALAATLIMQASLLQAHDPDIFLPAPLFQETTVVATDSLESILRAFCDLRDRHEQRDSYGPEANECIRSIIGNLVPIDPTDPKYTLEKK